MRSYSNAHFKKTKTFWSSAVHLVKSSGCVQINIMCWASQIWIPFFFSCWYFSLNVQFLFYYTVYWLLWAMLLHLEALFVENILSWPNSCISGTALAVTSSRCFSCHLFVFQVRPIVSPLCPKRIFFTSYFWWLLWNLPGVISIPKQSGTRNFSRFSWDYKGIARPWIIPYTLGSKP